MADDSSDLLEGLHSLDITACKEHIRQLQARRERRRELVERLQEKLKALNNELAARKEEADRCKKDLLEEQAKNRRLAEARRGQKAGKEVATIQDDQQREQEMDLQTANVRRFMESTLQEKVKRDSTQNELGIRIYDEVELMVEKSADEQAQESKYIDTVLVTYCIPNSELKYNLSFRVDRNMKTKKLREDACLYWGLSEVEFILKTMSNAKVHDELAIQSCFRENEDAHFSLVQKTPKNATLMDRELLHIMPKAGRKARRVAKQSAKRDEAKGDAATRTGVGDLAEQMLLLPGLFRYMTQRDKNVKQHLQRLKLRNICIYLAVLVMTIVDIYMRIPPALAFNCRQGVLELMTEGDGQGLSFDDIRSSDQVWLWLSDTVADQLLVPSSPLRTYNYPVGYLQVRLQEVQIPTQAQCPQLDLAYSVPENVTCFATRYTASKANTIEDDGVRHYFYGKSGYAGRYVNSAPWSFGNERSTSPAGEPWILGHFDEFDGSGQSIEYDLQYSPLDELRQAFLNDMLFLQGQNWLDPQSRALHVSFLLYNSNCDHFISNRYTVEMTAFGVVRPFSEIGVFRPGFVEYDLGFSMLSLDIIRLCFVLLICPVQIYWDFMYERRVNGAGCKHLYSVQGLADLAVGIIFFVMFGLRYGNFNVPSIDYFVQQAQTPLDAGEFAEQYNFHIVMDALISGLLLYRFAFFLRINRHFFLIWSTVEQAAMVGCRLLVIAVPVVVGLILVSMAVGGSYDENSRSFWSSLMRVMLLIYADVETVKDYDPNRGWQLSFNVALYFLMRLVFVNCWISVLIHEYQKVRVAAGSTETYRWKEYDYVVWCLPWPFRNLYLNFLRPKIERPAKDSVEE